MSNQKVRVNGEEFGVWFMHAQEDRIEKSEDNPESLSLFDETVFVASEMGQIKEHARDDNAPYIKAVTRCWLEREDRSVVAVGFAFCSREDQFNKERGRNISLARAIEWFKKGL